jgi:foldase protein PrsA
MAQEIASLKSNKNRYYLIAAAIVIIGGFFYFNNRKSPVVTINGTDISRDTYIAELEAQGGKQVLDQLVTEELIVAKAVEQNITVTPEDVDTEINAIKERILGSSPEGQDFEQALAAQGMTLASLQKRIYMQKLLAALMAEGIQVSDEEVQQYLEENQANLPEGADIDEELKASIKNNLMQEKQQASQSAFLDDLKASADIKYW